MLQNMLKIFLMVYKMLINSWHWLIHNLLNGMKFVTGLTSHICQNLAVTFYIIGYVLLAVIKHVIAF